MPVPRDAHNVSTRTNFGATFYACCGPQALR